MKTRTIAAELRIHAPLTAFGTVTGIVIMAVIIHTRLSREVSASLFWTFHPLHVVLSAFVTAAMYRLHATYAGELLLHLPHRIGAIEN